MFVCTKRSGRSLLLSAFTAGFLVGLSACRDLAPVASSDEDIVIGVIAPVDSHLFRAGSTTVEGASLAVKEINAAGGVAAGGRRHRIRLLVEGTDDRPETAVSKAFKLIDSHKVVALLGLPVSDSALAVAKVAEERRVPMISTVSTHPETTRGRRFVFRVIFHDSFQGRVVAEFACRDLGARTAGIVFDPGSAYSRGLAEEFRAAFERQGGEVTAQESYTADDVDASDRLLRIRQSGADVLVVPVYSALLPALIRQVRDVGIKAPVLGGDTWSNLALAERNGWSPAYFSDVWAPDSPRPSSRQFIESYLKEYGKPAVSYAALAYDAVLLLARAIEFREDATPESVRAGLLSLRGFVGVTGAIRYYEIGDPVRSAVIMSLADDGTARVHRMIDP